jgi:hypothetical protein
MVGGIHFSVREKENPEIRAIMLTLGVQKAQKSHKRAFCDSYAYFRRSFAIVTIFLPILVDFLERVEGYHFFGRNGGGHYFNFDFRPTVHGENV